MTQKQKLLKAKKIIKSMRSGEFNCYCGLYYSFLEKLEAQRRPDKNGKCWFTHSKQCAEIQRFMKTI